MSLERNPSPYDRKEVLQNVVAAADFRIAVGGIDPHYLAGWSGGAKNLLPGVAAVRFFPSLPAAVAAALAKQPDAAVLAVPDAAKGPAGAAAPRGRCSSHGVIEPARDTVDNSFRP